MSEQNLPRKFDDLVAQRLGFYVYVLRDPRDKKVFYVGEGQNSRVFEHFDEAQSVLEHRPERVSSKIRRIIEIWNEGLDVDWFIIRRSIEDFMSTPDEKVIAQDVEAAIIDTLGLCPNGPPLNDQSGKRSGVRGMLGPDEVKALGATPVDPSYPCHAVFVFPIQNALGDGRGVYEAVRRAWRGSRLMKEGVFAVGLASGISRGVFRVSEWRKLESRKWMFDAEEMPDHELLSKNWTSVINAARAYWQRGNYLVVEFDGVHQFRLLQGRRDKDQWLALR
jgi:hypothetical protein